MADISLYENHEFFAYRKKVYKKPMQFSENFNRDWLWYFKYRNIFNFDAIKEYVNKKGEALVKPNQRGLSAKECFYIFDSTGKIEPCKEPELLQEILRAKGSINLHIKMWAEARANCELSGIEFDEIIKQRELPKWVVKAVEIQKFKYMKKIPTSLTMPYFVKLTYKEKIINTCLLLKIKFLKFLKKIDEKTKKF